ncbi:hypothetical protein [Streptomyces sp. NBC_01497]|uniref:hypothetical protein n=1 Tax=Streptomyces sp. NBC_01497 TaxID=2903885 RepID=UPI002E37494F|nr:hypothetical protein [Streptomyces sp. NBC_01497]
MSEISKDEDITTLDRHVPAPPADGATDAGAVVAPTEAATTEAATDTTPIKPLDRHVP